MNYHKPLGTIAAICTVLLFGLTLANSASAMSFSPATNYPSGLQPFAVVSGDYDGDGKLDLATAAGGTSNFAVLFGNGAGGFSSPNFHNAGGQPFDIVSADFNGDGNLDLATANSFSNSLSVMLGNGTGGFSPPSSLAVGLSPHTLTAADFNGDGFTDLASGAYDSTVSVLLGNGSGGFGPAATFAAGGRPWELISADVNSDGNTDLVSANSDNSNFSILLGDGSGGFGTPTTFPTGTYPYTVTVADLNADGIPDLVSGSSYPSDLTVRLGTGGGAFGPPTSFPTGQFPMSLATADFDGDGNLDVASASLGSDTISVLLGDGSGGLGPFSSFGAGAKPWSLITEDFNGDGAPDLAASNRSSNNVSVLLNTTVLPRADVKITKTALPSNPGPGDTVTYTLKAQNVGTATATNVLVTDTLPVGVTFVSADSPCLESAGNVSCAIGSMNPGEERILEVKVKVDPWGSADPSYEHLVDVQRVEAQIDLNAGEQKTVQVSCPSGFFATDGSVRTDHIDQGTGDWTAPEVLESRATSPGTWQGSVKNTATGRAQAKIFAVCVRETTSPNGHSHNLNYSAPVTVSNAVLPGRREATLLCGPGQVAIQPGFISSAPADLVYSEPEGNGWKFALDVKAASDVTFSIRCLSRQVAVTHGHIHDLGFQHINREFTVEPGKVNEAQLTCADGYKGIVADQDLDHGLVSLGNDPRPVTRAFKLYNPTDHALNARLSLLCIADRTGGEHAPPKTIVNTAWISTTSNETNTVNNSSSATVTAEDTDIFDPVPSPPPVKPTPNNPIGMRIAGSHVLLRGNRVLATMKCSAACSGNAKLFSVRTVRVGGKKLKKGTVLAAARFGFYAAGERNLKLRVNANGRKVLKKGGNAMLKLSSGKKRIVRVR